MVVQIVVDDNADDISGAHGHRGWLRFWIRFRYPGRRTLSTYAVAGPTITATKGPHRGDRRDRQLRQDGGHDYPINRNAWSILTPPTRSDISIVVVDTCGRRLVALEDCVLSEFFCLLGFRRRWYDFYSKLIYSTRMISLPSILV